MKRFFLIVISMSILLNAELNRDSNGVVHDSKTNLAWQDSYQDNDRTIKTANWQDALIYCQDLTLGNNSDWRLPNINELLSITENDKNNPAINSYFIYISSNFYLSSTTLISDIDSTWGVNFIYGGSGLRNKSNKNLVRCVRTDK